MGWVFSTTRFVVHRFRFAPRPRDRQRAITIRVDSLALLLVRIASGKSSTGSAGESFYGKGIKFTKTKQRNRIPTHLRATSIVYIRLDLLLT